MLNKALLLSSNKPEKHKKLWSRFKITIGTGKQPTINGWQTSAIGWVKNSDGYDGNFGSYSHVSGVDLTKISYTQSDQILFKYGDGSFYSCLFNDTALSVLQCDNPYKTYLSNTLYDIVDDTFGVSMFLDSDGINLSSYLQNKIFYPSYSNDHVGKITQISVYVWDF